MADSVLVPPDHTVPVAFTRAQLDWLPWLDPLMADAMTDRHMASLVDAARVKSPYFRLLARDPDALEARTRTDKDIFYNPDAGLPRAPEGEPVAADDGGGDGETPDVEPDEPARPVPYGVHSPMFASSST